MISAEAPILFAKACELFITDLTFRALFNTNVHKRKTLQKTDIEAIVNRNEMFDFLIDIVPRDGTDRSLQHTRDAEKSYMVSAQRQPALPKPMLMDKATMLMRNPLGDPSPKLQHPGMQLLANRGNPIYRNAPEPSELPDFDGDEQYSMLSKVRK